MNLKFLEARSWTSVDVLKIVFGRSKCCYWTEIKRAI